jgi:lipopolysaccharide heptosyltransferase II
MKPYKVLVIQLTRMGDIIQTIPLLVRLREDAPNVHVTFVCVDRFAEIIKDVPLVNRYVKISPQEAVKLKTPDMEQIIKILSHPFLKEPYDLAINLTHDLSSAIIMHRIKADEKTGAVAESASDCLSIKDTWGRYLFASVNNREENSFNLVDIHIGMGKIHHSPVICYLKTDKKTDERIERLFSWLSISSDRPLVAFHTGANKLHRTWNPKYFAKLAELLIKHHNVQILLTGSDKEKALLEEFLANVPRTFMEKNHIVSLMGLTKLQDLIAILLRCKLLVSNDTGPIHIAAAVGTPTIGIYLSTAYPGETAPYGEGHHVLHPAMECYPCLDESSGFPCGIACRDKILPSTVFDLSTKLLIEDNNPLEIHHEGAVILKSRFLQNGTLIYTPLNATEAGIESSWFRKKILRILWDGVLGLTSDFSILSSLSKDEIARWAVKTKAILEEMCHSLMYTGRIGDATSLSMVSSLLIDFFNLSIHSGCISDIPNALIKMDHQITEIQKWLTRSSHFA